MRTLSSDMQTHVEGNLTTLALCFKIERTDGQVFAFTVHDVDITYDGTTYKSTNSGSASNLKVSSDMSVDNIDADVILDDDSITMKDLRAGLFDFATVLIFMVNYEDLADGAINCLRGTFGEVGVGDFTAKVEFRSLTQYLQQDTGRVYNYLCNVEELGDSRCGANISSFTHSGEVTAVTNRQTFEIGGDAGSQSVDYFKYGKLTWHNTSGEYNEGLSMEVKNFSGEIVLFQKMPYTVNVGDTFVVSAGCDREFDTCKNKFSNGANFRGFPHIPGRDKITKGIN